MLLSMLNESSFSSSCMCCFLLYAVLSNAEAMPSCNNEKIATRRRPSGASEQEMSAAN